jgi:death-on-curing protein
LPCEPFFLTVADVLALHELQLDRYGGSSGVRDPGLLESALLQAQAGFGGQYLHEDLTSMAAAYLFSIVKNHPFIDGNKRAGLASALTFLDLNGIPIAHSSEVLYETTMAVAEGRLDKDGLAAILRDLSGSTG